MILSMLPTTAFAGNEVTTILSIGDSITPGYGLADANTESFTAQIAAKEGYRVVNKAIDGNTMELLRSGILKPAEYATLFENANQANNATMCRLIAKAAADAAANAKDDDVARQFRHTANRGRDVNGQPYMDAFDSMADALDRSLRRTYLIPKWDELTAHIRENF